MWSYVPLEKVANICDGLRKPVNSKERAKRIEGKLNETLWTRAQKADRETGC